MMVDTASRRGSLDDLDLVLPDVWTARFEDGRWVRSRRSWAIKSPQAKLVAKYTRGTSAIFSHYVFQFPHRDPDRVTDVDMAAADNLMGANISAQNVRWQKIASLDRQEALASVLGRIPVVASIEDTRFDGDVCKAVEILTEGGGVQLAIATKLLCIKRPYLIPMMDSVVQYCMGSDQASVILGEFRRLLALPEVFMRVDALARHVKSIIGAVPSRVRILDELIWFDWNVRRPDAAGLCEVVGFADWVYDTAHDERGIYHVVDA